MFRNVSHLYNVDALLSYIATEITVTFMLYLDATSIEYHVLNKTEAYYFGFIQYTLHME